MVVGGTGGGAGAAATVGAGAEGTRSTAGELPAAIPATSRPVALSAAPVIRARAAGAW